MNRSKKEEKKRKKKFPTYKLSEEEYAKLTEKETAERLKRLEKLSKPK